MDLAFHFAGEYGMNTPLAFQPRNAFERRRNDTHAEMGFAAVTMARMALMPRAVIDNVQRRRRKGGGKLIANGVCN